METTVIVIIGVCYIVLAICGISTSCESTRNKNKIRDLEIEVDILKDKDKINDKFTDNLYDSAIDCTNKINDLKKEIENLKQAMKTVIPPNDYRTIYCDGSTCTNPFRDCVNCPNQFSSGGTVTTTDTKEDERSLSQMFMDFRNDADAFFKDAEEFIKRQKDDTNK